MIIETLLNLLYSVFKVLTLPINIPSLPDSVHAQIEEIFGILQMGGQILGCYSDLGYLMTLFGIILAIDIGVGLYHFVMWVLKKIPMISIS